MVRKLVITLLVLTGLLFLPIFPNVNVIRGSAGGVLYWNQNEALLFMTGNRSGARMSYGRYLLEPFLVRLGDVRQPNNERCSESVVMRVTDGDVQRFDTDLFRYADVPYCGFHFDLLDGQIYVVSGSKLWNWSGKRFEPAPPEKLQAFDAAGAAKGNSTHPWAFDDVEGWSMRELGANPPQMNIVLSGQPVRIIFHGPTWPPRPITVDLIRPGKAPETIWRFDEEPHRVSKSEYERVFVRY